MRTTVDIDDDLLAEAKAVAVRERRSVRSLIEEGLRRVIIRHPLETAMGESRGGGAPFFAIELNTMSVIK